MSEHANEGRLDHVLVWVRRKADASALIKFLQPYFRVEIQTAREKSEPSQDNTTFLENEALLILDGVTLWHHAQKIRQKRMQTGGARLFVLLLLTAGRGRAWPERKFRDCYDDVLQGPLDPSETLLRVRQMLDHQRVNTENREAIESIRLAAEHLMREKAKREEFIVTLSHDLRSPLTAARIGTERLLREMSVELRQTRITRVLAALDRINNMIEDLLNAARREMRKDFVSPKKVHRIRTIAEAALADLIPVFGDRFVLEIPTHLEAYVQEDTIMRVLENLCSNAVKYGHTDAPIIVGAFLDGELIVLQVANEGDSISAIPMNSLFEVFEQAPLSSAKVPSSGWGLGLAMVRAAAEAHGGTTCSFRDARKRNVFGIKFPSFPTPLS